MRIPGLSCPNCGSENLRRSKRQSLGEIGKMLLGAYPFRCLKCGSRFWMSIWLFSKLATAKCPKCLRTDLVTWPEKYYRPTFWRRVEYTLGAHCYRCNACRCNFISFRGRIADETVTPPPSPPEKSLHRSGSAE
ncbi:MAG: hypothetical protein JWP08_813 [Bryobacterales bacterium]|nr:hypothetical protein [Bryobacterales bacterium]